MGKKWKITYKNLNIIFGDNVFTKVLIGETPERALSEYAMDNRYVLRMISAEEITDEQYWSDDNAYWYGDLIFGNTEV